MRRAILVLNISAFFVSQMIASDCGETLGSSPGMSDFYNAACCYALAGETDRAFGCLENAIDSGWYQSWLMEIDSDFATLRDDERWKVVIKQCRDQEIDYEQGVNKDLYHMFRDDQLDRMVDDIDWNQVVVRDSLHRSETLGMLEQGMLNCFDDYIHAAFIFQHGMDSTSYRVAHEMALKAVELKPESCRARWIAAASKDRYLHSVEKPQWYGTQTRHIDGVWTIYPVDTVKVTDKDRQEWCVPDIATAKARADRMNQSER